MLEKIFKSNREEFLEFIDYMSDAVFVMEVEEGFLLRYVAVNKIGMEMAGLKKTVIGKRIEDVMPLEESIFLNRKYREVIDNGSSCFFDHRTQDNRIGESSLNPILNNEGNITYILSVTRDITAWKAAEKELQEYKQKYRSMVDYNPDAIYEMDFDGNITSINESGIQFVGYHREEMLSHSFFPYVSEMDLDRTLRYFNRAKEGVSQEYEIELIHKKGHSVSCLIKNVPIFIDEKIIGIYGIAKNITNEKTLLQSLKESEERHRRLVDNSPDPMFIHYEGFIEYANNAAIRLLGVSDSGQLIGKSIYDLSPIMYRDIINERNRTIIEGDSNTIRQAEEELVTVEGRRIFVELTSISTIYKGKKAIHAVVRDISERKQLEVALQESEERYRLIAENSTDLIQLLDVKGEILYASPSHEKVSRWPPEQFVGQPFSNFLQEEEIIAFGESLSKMVQNKEITTLEFHLTQRSGGWLWVSCELIPILDEEGQLEKILVVGEDITERKKHEEEIYHMAYHDQLTGLPNRQLFSDRLQQALVRAKRNQSQIAVMYLDCDHFKPINDELGHDAGDEFLKSLAGKLNDCIRESDTVARIGGDEFNILLPDIQDDKEVITVAERIIASVNLPWEWNGKPYKISMSIGISLFPKDGDEVKVLIKKADEALYLAKESGRGMFKVAE